MTTPRNHPDRFPRGAALRGDALRDHCALHKLPIPPPAVVDELNRRALDGADLRTIHGPHAEGQGEAEEWQALYQREVVHGQRMRRNALIVGLLNGIGIGLCLEILIRTLLQ